MPSIWLALFGYSGNVRKCIYNNSHEMTNNLIKYTGIDQNIKHATTTHTGMLNCHYSKREGPGRAERGLMKTTNEKLA